MSLDKDSARQALDEMERTRDRARVFSGYRRSGPIFAAWGVAWLVGNLANYYALPFAGPIYSTLIAAAAIVSAALGRPPRQAPAATPALRRKSMLAVIVIVAAAFGMMLIVAPLDRLMINALISYLVGAIYTVFGIWVGTRIAWLGVVLMATVLAAWFGAREHFELIMGLAGGGALLATGIWLWRQ